jgi:hypothetical protein
MRLDQAAIVLRPRGILGSGDLAFRFVFGLRPRLWLVLSAIALVPGFVGSSWLRHGAGWDWFPIWCVVLVYGSLAQGVFSTAAGLLMFDKSVTLGAIVRHFARRLVPFVVALLWTRALALAFTVLGIFLLVRWSYVHESVLLEQASAFRAGRRSSDFTKGHFEDAFGLVTLVACFNVAFAVAGEELGHGIEQLLLLPIHAEKLWDVGGSDFALFGYFASLPLCAVLRFLSYIDGRTRRDGWDIQVRFMALAGEAAKERGEGRLEAPV